MNTSGKEIRLLHLCKALSPGGTERLVLDLCRAHHRKVAHLVVASSGGSWEPELEKLGVRHIRVPSTDRKNPLSLFLAYRKLRAIVQKEGINLIHAHHRQWSALAQWLRISPRPPLLTTYHYFFPNRERLTRPADWNVAVSEELGAYLRELGFPEERTEVIPAAIGLPPNPPPFPAPSPPLKLLALQRLSPEKGVDRLLKALALCDPKVHCTIAGTGPEERRLKALARRLGLEQRCRFVGEVQKPGPLWREHHALCLPSRQEGLGLTVLEAFAQARPVLTLDLPPLRQLVTVGVTGLRAENDTPQALARAMNHMLALPELLEGMGLCARAWLERSPHQTRGMAQAYLERYRKLLS